MSQEPGWGLVEEGLGLGPPAHGHSLPRTPFLDHDSHREPVNGLVSSSPSQLQFGLTLAPLSCSLPPTERTYLPGMLNINGTVEKPTSTSAQKANRDAVSFFQEDQQHHSVAQTSSLPSLTKLQRLDFRKKMDFANDCLKLLNFQSGFLLHKYQPPPHPGIFFSLVLDAISWTHLYPSPSWLFFWGSPGFLRGHPTESVSLYVHFSFSQETMSYLKARTVIPYLSTSGI